MPPKLPWGSSGTLKRAVSAMGLVTSKTGKSSAVPEARNLHIKAGEAVGISERVEKRLTTGVIKMLASEDSWIKSRREELLSRQKTKSAASSEDLIVSDESGLIAALSTKIANASLARKGITKELVEEYKKELERDPEGRPTMIGNIHNLQRKGIFILSNISFDFNFAEGQISFKTEELEKLREKYKEKFVTTKYDTDDFDSLFKEMMLRIKEVLSSMRPSKIYGNDLLYGSDLSALLKESQSRIYRGNNVTTKENDLEEEMHMVNSPFRNEDVLSAKDAVFPHIKFHEVFATSLIISAVLEDAAKKAYGNNYDAFFRKLPLSEQQGSVAFPRDYSIYYENSFHQTDPRIAQAMAYKKDMEGEVKKLASNKGDLELDGQVVAQDIPFDAKGGNIIFTKNSQGEKIMVAAVSDAYFSDEGKFQGGYMINENGELYDYGPSMIGNMLGFGDKYNLFRERIKTFGESIGYKTIIVDRNQEGIYKDKFNEIYHADLFCGALPNGFFVVNPQAVTQENIAQIKSTFGEEKIIELSPEEQKELCANFVVFNKMVVMSSPKTPQSFIEKLNQRGFDVYVPEVYLTYPDTLKQGWPAGIRCCTTTKTGFQKTLDVVPQLGGEPKTSPLQATASVTSLSIRDKIK